MYKHLMVSCGEEASPNILLIFLYINIKAQKFRKLSISKMKIFSANLRSSKLHLLVLFNSNSAVDFKNSTSHTWIKAMFKSVWSHICKLKIPILIWIGLPYPPTMIKYLSIYIFTIQLKSLQILYKTS